MPSPQIRVTTPRLPVGKHVALLQANPSEGELLRDWLVLAGHVCTLHTCGYAFIRALRAVTFDIVVMDWNVRNIAGEAVLKHIRATLQSQVPVIFVSDLDQEQAIVAALRGGADDYVVKPVRRFELLARLDALSRRSRPAVPPPPPLIDRGSLQIDCRARIAMRDDKPVALTAKGFDLAVLFLSNVGRLLSRGQIHNAVWGAKTAFESRTMDTYVSRVRTQLGLTPAYGWRLAAIYGHGYRLDSIQSPRAFTRPSQPQEQSLSNSAA